MSAANPRRAAAALVAVLAVAGAPTAAADVNFDDFLTGVERCEPTPAFNDFWKALAERYPGIPGEPTEDPTVTVPIPPAVRDGVGKENGTYKPGQSYTDVVVPLSGRYRGLKLASLQFSLGSHSVSRVEIRFAEPRARVVSAFKAIIDEAKPKMLSSDSVGTDDKGIIGDIGFPENGDAAVYCDLSW